MVPFCPPSLTGVHWGLFYKALKCYEEEKMGNVNIDPLTVAIIEKRLLNLSEEFGERVMHSTHSFATAHIRDMATTVFDRKEQLVGQGSWHALHCAGSNVALKAMLDCIGRDNMRPRDFIMANDPFVVKHGHLPDWSFLSPVFYKGELAFYLYLRTHQYDTGGAYQGAYSPRPYDCHAEGLIIPPIKVIDQGEVREDLYQLILRNVRGAHMMRMDHMLIYHSMRKAEERLLSMCDLYGKDAMEASMDEFIRASEKFIRKTISTWPSGTYKSESACDSDGTLPDPVWFRLTLTIDADRGELIFDFSESQEQVDFVNCTIGHAWSGVVTSLRWILPSLPSNQSIYNCIKIKTKEGTVVDPVYPASTGAQAISTANIIECVQLALGQAIPKDVPACWTRRFSPILQGKKYDRKTGERGNFFCSAFHSDGSSGAIWGFDGWDALGAPQAGGGALRAPLEIEEAEIPWRWLCSEMLQDSSGQGQFRGGMGSHVKYLNISDPATYRPGDCLVLTGNSDGEKFPPFGLLGGTSSRGNELWLIRNGERIPFHTKSQLEVQPGDIIETFSGGGGGVGNPLDRDPDKVREDALNEYISIETAREIYKVVIDPKTFEVDYHATNKLRKKARGRN
jgi:N-methylhydantoinase B